jgi:hypothetical protein
MFPPTVWMPKGLKVVWNSPEMIHFKVGRAETIPRGETYDPNNRIMPKPLN